MWSYLVMLTQLQSQIKIALLLTRESNKHHICKRLSGGFLLAQSIACLSLPCVHALSYNCWWCWSNKHAYHHAMPIKANVTLYTIVVLPATYCCCRAKSMGTEWVGGTRCKSPLNITYARTALQPHGVITTLQLSLPWSVNHNSTGQCPHAFISLGASTPACPHAFAAYVAYDARQQQYGSR